MKINFKDPKVVLPLFVFVGILAFIFIFYKGDDEAVIVEDTQEINTNVGNVSSRVEDSDLSGKLDSYRQNFNDNKRGYTAIQTLDEETEKGNSIDLYTDEEKAELERIEQENQRKKDKERMEAYKAEGYKKINTGNNTSSSDADDLEDLRLAVNHNLQPQINNESSPEEQSGPNALSMMKEQYLFLDSLQKANDPDEIARLKAEERDRKIYEAIEKDKLSSLQVGKVARNKKFNTVQREGQGQFIKAIIDENITGYAGSRIRIRLLEDVYVGNQLFKKNNYMYAIITGFNEQRVRLNIMSVMHQNRILPIKLNIYDVDGLEGLYVPSSQFREFTKELGSSTVQGMNTNSTSGDGSDQQQFFTSIMQRVFTSTSSALSKIIRMNRANIKYNTHVFLIDDKALQEARKDIYEQNKNN